MKDEIQEILMELNRGRKPVSQALTELLVIFNVGRSLPHETEIEAAIDKLLIIRGEHPSRVRNPIYGEERQLAKDAIKYVLLKQ